MVAIATEVAGSLQVMLRALHLPLIYPAMLLAMASLAPQAPAAAQVEVDGRLRVLFLGDRGHHQPEARLHQVYGELGRARIAVDYEETVRSDHRRTPCAVRRADGVRKSP